MWDALVRCLFGLCVVALPSGSAVATTIPAPITVPATAAVSAMATVPAAATIPNQGHSITVMSYNIHFGVGIDGGYNLERIAQAIRKSHADIAGLQEVDVHYSSRSNFDDQAQILAKKLHMNYYFAPMYDFNPYHPVQYIFHPFSMNQRRQSGVAVLSKFPIVKTVNHSIARLSTEELDPPVTMSPGFAEAWIDVYGNPIPVFVTHLDYRLDKRIRMVQIDQMASIITNSHSSRQILLGDLNAIPSEYELNPLFAQGFRDAASACTDTCNTFPSNAPARRIDYVLCTNDWKAVSAKVIKSIASDHRPMTAKLYLR